MKLIAHLAILSLTFIIMLALLTLALAVVLVTGSFMFWMIPPVPTLAIVYFVIRVFIVVSVLITISYALSADYKQSVQDYLAK